MSRLVPFAYLFFFFSMLFAGCSGETSPQVESFSRKNLFDYNWKFKLDSIIDASAIDFKDEDWRQLDLPHDWSIEGKIEKSNPTGNDGGYFPAGIGWYRKSFDVPAQWEGKSISIYFEGVYMNAEVFINGKSLGVHPYGYTSFFHDLSEHLQYGASNVIAVKVDNSIQKNCRWYSGSGIYRHVWLQVKESVHVDQWGLAITTPAVSIEKSTVKVETIVRNEGNVARQVQVLVQIKNEAAQAMGNNVQSIEIKPNSTMKVEQELTVSNPLLWSPESPNLYRAEISIESSGGKIDQVTKTFGIRTIEYSAETGFLLNGKPTIINGGCVHHDNGCLGAKAYDRTEERKVELLIEAGFNAVRTSHNPPSEAFLDACDRLGILVIDEAFDGWRQAKAPQAPMDYSLHFDEWWQNDIDAMVHRDRNHPSIIMWSIGNEIIERTEPQAVETANMLASRVREIDPTRPVTSAMTSWGQGWDIFDPLMAAHDICGYNYQMHHAESDHERVPDRIILHTESYPKDAFYIWNLVQKHNYIIGDFVWTAMDYLGESSIGRYYYPGEPDGQHWEKDFFPWHGAYCGDIDLIGWRKPISHYRSMLYNDNEKLYLAVREPNPKDGEIKLTGWAVWPTWESWNWPGYEGQAIQVEVYSKYPKVRLYLNDELIGEKATTVSEEFKAVFDVPYAEGVLKVAGVESPSSADFGDQRMEEVEFKTLQSSGKPAQISLIADRTEIGASGQDLSFITVEITDEDGILVPNAELQLEFSIDGPGVIEGVDNANLKDLDSYVGNSRRTWNGRALVVVRGKKEAAKIKLTVSAPDLPDANIEIVNQKQQGF